ncbi:MAG: sulfatase-like hydrolase/transferase [Akkermansia sp.]|nr:sulfatase-like hydrolase/transferase [Akkermansia sp.]
MSALIDKLKKILGNKYFYILLAVSITLTILKLRVDLGAWTIMSIKNAELFPKFIIVSLHIFISCFLLTCAVSRSRIAAYVILPYTLILWIIPLFILFTRGYIEFDILVISLFCTDWNEISSLLNWKEYIFLIGGVVTIYTLTWLFRRYTCAITTAYHRPILISTVLYISITSALTLFLAEHSPKTLLPLITHSNTAGKTPKEIEFYEDNLVPQVLNPAYPSYVYRSLLPFSKQIFFCYYAWNFYKESDLKKSDDLPTDATRCPENITIVFFIGESYRSDHASWNGYHRETLPCMSRRLQNIINFPYVASYQTSTVPSIYGILSDATCNRREAHMTSFLGVMKKHGFSTDMVLCRTTNWHFVPYINSILDNKLDSTYMAEDTEAMLNKISELVARPGRKIIIIEDGLGHFPYEHDEQFNTFGNQKPIDKYDNALLQTDDIMNRIVGMLENQNSVFLYSSDHGQSFGEQGYWMHGASLSLPHQRHVFTYLWTSQEYAVTNRELLNVVKANSHKYISHDDIYFTILSLSGLDCDTEEARKYNLTQPLPDRPIQNSFILQN